MAAYSGGRPELLHIRSADAQSTFDHFTFDHSTFDHFFEQVRACVLAHAAGGGDGGRASSSSLLYYSQA